MKLSITDCVTELFSYTFYLVDNLATSHIDFNHVSDNYISLIAQSRACAQKAGISKAKIDKAFFAVFAWVDETLVNTSWDYREEWIKNSLQKTHFNTTNAGETFFKNLEKLNKNEPEIIEVYQYCLASGFKGNMFESFLQEKLNSFKENTLKQIKTKEELKIPEILFPKSGYTEISKTLKRKRWKGLAGFSYLFILLPILLFVTLFYFYNKALIDMVNNL